MDYKDFLEKVASYGNGVFTLTMISDEKNRAACRKWMPRHPSLFNSLKGAKNDLQIHVLNNLGLQTLGIEKKRLTSAESFASLVDMALINSYMFESNIFSSYSYKPNLLMEIGEKKVSIISLVWGVPKNIKEASVVLATYGTIKDYEKNKNFIKQDSKKSGLNESELRNIIQNAYTPIALQTKGLRHIQ